MIMCGVVEAKIITYWKWEKEYTLEDIIVHSWHTIVYIEEFPDMEFNSVAFEEID